MQPKDFAGLELKDSTVAGFGMFTTTGRKKGDMIMPYVGGFHPGNPPPWEFRYNILDSPHVVTHAHTQ